MTKQMTAIIEREGDGYVSLCPELDIASQGATVAEARENLKEALELFFETASANEIQSRLHHEVYVTQVEVAVALAPPVFGSRGPRDPREKRLYRGSAQRQPCNHAKAGSRRYHYRPGSRPLGTTDRNLNVNHPTVGVAQSVVRMKGIRRLCPRGIHRCNL